MNAKARLGTFVAVGFGFAAGFMAGNMHGIAYAANQIMDGGSEYCQTIATVVAGSSATQPKVDPTKHITSTNDPQPTATKVPTLSTPVTTQPAPTLQPTTAPTTPAPTQKPTDDPKPTVQPTTQPTQPPAPTAQPTTQKGNPGNDKNVGNAGEKDGKCFNSPNEGGPGTKGKSDNNCKTK